MIGGALTLASFAWAYCIPAAAFFGLMVLWRQIGERTARLAALAALGCLAVGLAALGVALLADPGDPGIDRPGSRDAVRSLAWLATGLSAAAAGLIASGLRRPGQSDSRRLLLVPGLFVTTAAGVVQLLAMGGHLLTG